MEYARAGVMAVMLLGAFGLFGHTVFSLSRYVFMGRRTPVPVVLPRRISSFVKYVLGQGRVILEPAGIAHFFIFWGFLVLQLETIEYFIRGFYWKFHMSAIVGETLYQVLLFGQDLAGFAVLAAVIFGAVRRYAVRPQHAMASMDAAIILGLIGFLMITKFIANGAEIAMISPDALGHNPHWTPIALGAAYMLADGPGSGINSTGLEVAYNLGYWLHVGIVLFFLNYIPFGKHLHLLGAMPNVFFRKVEPRGALYSIDMDAYEASFESETPMKIGAENIEDLTWKQLLDTYACTECGRCEHYCPAYNTGKPLNPMMVIHNIKEHIREKGDHVLRKKLEGDGALDGPDNHITHAFDTGGKMPGMLHGVITAEELWACTTCGACVGNCPVFIEHVDTIVDMRRFLVMGGDSPQISPEVARTFRNLESASNPWGISGSFRGDWTEGLQIPVLSQLDYVPEYLFYVGCAGSFDDRQKKVTVAFARILKNAGVDFAILGREEKCTGDPARRIGNEYLYQSLAKESIEVLNKYKVTKVITTCPHCYHTIGKEYPQLGGNYEVIHHTELLAELIRTNKLQLKPGVGERITYHDSCYIGRWAQIYDAPRDIIDAIPNVTRGEMDLNKRQAFCCGAGGGRMWMEEDLGKRINYERADQALATEPDVVAVACPFCLTMIDDGVKYRGADHVQLKDLAEIVSEHMVVHTVLETATDEAG